jgi:beta-lactamase class A
VPIIMGTGVDTWSSVSDTIEDRIRTLFASVEAQGFLDVREIGGSGSVSVDADAPVAAASVIKILLCLAFAREVAAGTIPAAERAEVPAAHRVGGAGTTGCRDPVQMSLRDLALFMMTTSDNAATDVILERTGRAAIDAVLDELNLSETHFRGGMMWGHMRVVEALGLPSARDLDDQIEGADQAAVWSLAWLDPKRSNASTARDITRLLEATARDRPRRALSCGRRWLSNSRPIAWPPALSRTECGWRARPEPCPPSATRRASSPIPTGADTPPLSSPAPALSPPGARRSMGPSAPRRGWPSSTCAGRREPASGGL